MPKKKSPEQARRDHAKRVAALYFAEGGRAKDAERRALREQGIREMDYVAAFRQFVKPCSLSEQERYCASLRIGVDDWSNDLRSTALELEDLRLFPVIAEGWQIVPIRSATFVEDQQSLRENITLSIAFADKARATIAELTSDGKQPTIATRKAAMAPLEKLFPLQPV